MKISHLQEGSEASMPSLGQPAAEFGRDKDVLESDAGTSTASGIASSTKAVGGMQRRGKGSMLQGIKTSDKYANSQAVKESYYNHDDNRTGFSKPVRQDDERNPEFDDKMRKLTGMIFYNVTDPEQAQQIGLKQTRTGKWFLRTGNRMAQQVADRAFGPGKVWYPKNESMEEGQQWPDSSNSLADRDVVSPNIDSYRRGEIDRSKAHRRPGGMTVATRVDPTITPTSVQRKDSDRPIPSFLQKEDTESAPASDLKTWQVVIMNNYYRGKYSDYSGRYYYVLASSPEEAKQVVMDNADGILQDLLSMKSHNGKKILPRGSAVRITPDRIGKIEDGTVAGRMSTSGYKKMFSPQGLVMAKLSGGDVVDIQDPVVQGHDLKTVSKADLGQNKLNLPSGYGDVVQPQGVKEQEVDEASFDYTMKDLGNDYAGFPSNHSLKHKFLARIKPEKQQLYKDKMNNMQGFDQLFKLFTVAKQRGDIIDQEVAEAGNPVDTDWYRKQQERQTRAKQRQDRQQQSVEEGYPKHQDLSGISTDRLKAYVKKVSGGGVPQFGAGAQLKRVQQELKRREQGVAEGMADTIKQGAKKAWDWATEPTHQAHDIIVKDRAKNIAKIRKQEAKKSVLEKDPEAMREFERSGGYKAGLDIMGWQVGWAAASHAKSTDTAKDAFQKLYYGGGSPFPFDIKSFKLAWVAYKKHHGPQGNLEEAEFTEDKLASDLYKDLQMFKKGADKDIGAKAKDKEIGNKPSDKDIVAKEDCWKGYTQYGMKDKGGKKVPNCVPTNEETIDEVAAWQKKSGKNKTGGLNQKGVDSYRKEHPGSKLQTAVTTPPSKLKPGSKDAKRRKSFCARMSGMEGPMKDEKGEPTRKALSLKKWNC